MTHPSSLIDHFFLREDLDSCLMGVSPFDQKNEDSSVCSTSLHQSLGQGAGTMFTPSHVIWDNKPHQIFRCTSSKKHTLIFQHHLGIMKINFTHF